MPVSHQASFYQWCLSHFGREPLAYLTGNTMNLFTTRLSEFFWTYDCKAIVLAVRPETQDAVTVELLPNPHFCQPKPGQHIEVAVDLRDSGELTRRCYSITEATEHSISITVKRKPKGSVSTWIHRCLQPGRILDISAPRGQFVFRPQPAVTMICAGSGITPCYAILQDIERNHPATRARLFYRSARPENTLFRYSLNQHRNAPNYVFSYSQGPMRSPFGSLEEEFASRFPIKQEEPVYLCGPESFRDAVILLLEKQGYDLKNLIIENFGAPGRKTLSRDSYRGKSTITLANKNLSFTVEEAQKKTLLEAAEEAGIALEHGCRSGMCGTCKTRLLEGSVSGNQLGDHVYPCSSYAASASVILE